MLRRNIFFILSSDIFVIIVGLFIFSYYSKLDVSSFSLYSLSKRAVSFLQPFLFFNFGLGVTKILSSDIGNQEKILRGSLLFLIMNFFLISILILFSLQLSYLIFGSKRFYLLTISMLFYIFALNVHSLIISVMRGYYKFKTFSLINSLNLGLVPIMSIWISDKVENFYFLNSLLILFYSFIFSIFILKIHKRVVFKLKSFSDVICDIKEIFSFSLLRMPSDYMLSLIFYLPVLSVTHIFSHNEGGYFGFAVSLINLVGALLNPIGVIMFPYSIKLLNNNKRELINNIHKIIYSTLVLSITFVILYFILKNFLFYFFSENTVNDTIKYLDIMIFSLIGYNLYVSLRSIVDSCDSKPRNVYNILVTLLILIFFIFIFIFFKIKFLAPLSLTVSLTLLGILTVYFLFKLVHRLEKL